MTTEPTAKKEVKPTKKDCTFSKRTVLIVGPDGKITVKVMKSVL